MPVIVLVIMSYAVYGRDVEPPSVEFITDGLSRAERAFFESGKLTLRYTRIESLNMGATGALQRVEWLLGRNGSAWYQEARSLDPMETPEVSVSAEPRVYILRGGVSLDWTQENRYVFLAPKDNFNVLHGWHHLENAGFNPYRQVIESIGRSYDEAARDKKSMLHQFLRRPLLPDFLSANAAEYKVLREPEPVDGNTCWVIEWPGMDKIWVDVDHGFAVHRRIFRWKVNGPRARQVDNSDFREIKPGLWLCFRQVVDSYVAPETVTEAEWDTVANRSTYEVSHIDLSRAPEGLISVQLPVGTHVTDQIRKINYTVTDEQGDPFEKALGEAKESARVTRRTGIIGPIIIVNALLLALVAIYVFLRRKKAAAAVLVAICNFAAGATAREHAVMWPARDHAKMVDDKGEWLWKPAWLEMNACGPNSLFVLLKLLGKNVTLDQVKDRVKCDPVRGCTMADLSDAASAFDVPADVRFVHPNELADVPFPFILHGISGLKAKTGHFVVVVGRDSVKQNLATIDPMRETFQWDPERGFVSDFSGYILVPRRHSVARPTVLLALGLTLISIGSVWRYRTRGGQEFGSRADHQVIET